MILVTFLYPNTEGSRFDMNYYAGTHVELARKCFGDSLKSIEVEKGVSGIEPGSKPPFHAVGRLKFDSLESFYGALMPNIDELKGDVPNYTDVEPVIQIGTADLG